METGIKLIAVRGMKFPAGTVIDPEVRVPKPASVSRGPSVTRCARLKCSSCGTVFLAPLSPLFRNKIKSCGCRVRKRGQPGVKKVRLSKNRGGYAITAYLGWVRTREEAEAFIPRVRVTLLPKPPIPHE